MISSIKGELADFSEPFEIMVVDDGSTDGTAEVLKSIEGIRILTHDRNMGYGATLKTGIKDAAGKIILIMDADLSYPAEQIAKMLELVKECDMVVGARQSPIIKHFLIRGVARYLFKVTASIIMRTWIPDLNSGMRAFSTDLARKYAGGLPDGFSASSTLTAFFMRNGHTIHYLDIPYRSRIGTSKLRMIPDAIKFLNFLLKKQPKSN